jgi:hypothetical protein
MTHLDALELNLSHERVRLAEATSPEEVALRRVWVSQLEREVAGERAFLGQSTVNLDISDDDLFNELLN